MAPRGRAFSFAETERWQECFNPIEVGLAKVLSPNLTTAAVSDKGDGGAALLIASVQLELLPSRSATKLARVFPISHPNTPNRRSFRARRLPRPRQVL